MTYRCPESKLNVLDVYTASGLSDEQITEVARAFHMPYSLMIYNCHGDFNTSILCRTASCFSAKHIFTVGRRKFDRRPLVGSHNYTHLTRIDEIPDRVAFFLEHNMYPVFIEQGGISLSEYRIGTYQPKHPETGCALDPCLVVGSECDGLPQDFLDEFPESPILTIPQSGPIRSLNVSTAGAIVLCNIYHQNLKNTMDRYGLC